MSRLILICVLFFIPLANIFGQKERKMVREGVKEYQDDKFSEAEVQFRKALDEKPGLYEADYNIANSLYKQKKYEEAAKEYDRLVQNNNDPEKRADLFHNLGNSQLMSKQYEKGIDAYKNSLRIRPKDEDTRYNLAYALAKLKEQQQQKQNDQNKDKQDKDKQQQDQKDQKNQQDQEKKDQQQNKQQDKKEDQKKEQQNNTEQKLSQQEAEQMLNAVQNQEKEVKEKVDKKKAVARPVRTEKEW